MYLDENDGYSIAACESEARAEELARPKPFALATDPPPTEKPKKQYADRNKTHRRPTQPKPQKLHYETPIANTEELWFRHTHWQTKRALVLTALQTGGASRNQVESFENCGADCVVEIDPATTKYRLRATYCHNRHCEPCQRAKANLLAANLREKLGNVSAFQFRFITLTLKHNNAPLREQITRLYASFKKLRNTPEWKKSQIGGAAVLEVKWKPETRHWHPHLHVIAEGSFLRQETLAKLWLTATGDSRIVDIRTLDSGKDAAHYVAKYVSKGTNDAVWNDTDAAQEWILAMHGVRTAATYGTWRGFKLLKVTPSTADWKRIGSLSNIVREARNGNAYYVRLLQTLATEKQYDPHKKRGPKADSPPPVVS